jgi:hypothetical protein
MPNLASAVDSPIPEFKRSLGVSRVPAEIITSLEAVI